ncbi:HXXEE domain-containing protein [Mesorhizobium sp. B2-3-4]|uniref:HXXEE domain-containing protein n=1 Tax=Mesorhizobium sp. B2-3-4 TaxID=2589959 RepID=UPI00112A8742|nr:HXXEE domain-containing protein [Mesorhizobium sp. B2-3-4]TPM31813.1 HXXEE domain-containing protein [Mesorhizobium sp. B2-3-4]
MKRLVEDWVYGGVLAGLVLCIVAIGLAARLETAELAVFVLIPVYMLHQYEEHAGDRFRLFVNKMLGAGAPLLTRLDVFVINVPGVWGIYALVFTLAVTIQAGIGLIAAYTTLINALVHIGQAIRMRSYNPGLVTAIILFVPVSIWSIWALSGSGTRFHVLGVAVGLVIHGLIIAHVARRRRMTRSASSELVTPS